MGIDDVITRVERAGDANRKTLAPTSKWLPKPNSPLWGVYYRFYKEVGWTVPEFVGRCIFWEVVVILAPGRWLMKYLSRPAQMSFPAILLMLALVLGLNLAVILLTGNWWAIPAGLGFAAALVGIIGGLIAYVAMASEGYDVGEVIEEIVGEEKFSWGAIALLLCGPFALVGLLIGFLIHCIGNVVGWIQDEVGEEIVMVFKIIVISVVVVGGVGGAGLLVYMYLVSPFGWAVTGGTLSIIALVGGLSWRFRPQISDFGAGVSARWETRQARIVEGTATSGKPPRPSFGNRLLRIGRGIVTALCVVRDLVRLVWNMIVYGYKQICDLAPVPAHLLEQQKRDREQSQESNDEEEEAATV